MAILHFIVILGCDYPLRLDLCSCGSHAGTHVPRKAHELLYGWGCEGIESVLVLLVASLCVPVVRGISELFAKLLGVGI